MKLNPNRFVKKEKPWHLAFLMHLSLIFDPILHLNLRGSLKVFNLEVLPKSFSSKFFENKLSITMAFFAVPFFLWLVGILD